MEYKYKFSVIMPIYNVETYIREAIESVVNQTVGFEENIQLILINDGSKDHSEEICLEYLEKYPDNIVYIFQENSGVSSARNRGFQYIQGELVNFLDPDDKWDADAFQIIDNFFQKNPKADLATTTMKFFDKKEGFHPLNYRMNKGERVADIYNPEEYNSIVMHVTSTFFRAEAIEDARFPENLIYSEDSFFISRIVLKKRLIGFIPKATHYYRKRQDDSSALQKSKVDPVYFTSSLDTFSFALAKLSEEMYHEVIPYIQNVIYYDLAWRFRIDISNVLDPSQKTVFFEKAHQLLQKINDEVIVTNKTNSNFVYKNIAWNLKYGHDITEDVDITKDGTLRVNGQDFFKMYSKGVCQINFLEISDNRISVEGTVSKWIFNCIRLHPIFLVTVNGEKFLPDLWENDNSSVDTIIGKVRYQYRFRVNLPQSVLKDRERNRLQVGFILSDIWFIVGLKYGRYVPNWNSSKWICKSGEEGFVCTARKSFIEIWRPAHPFLSKIRHEFYHQRWLRQKGFRKVANFRLRYLLHRFFHHPQNNIWLISDREMNAGDNGETFFKYLNSLKNHNIRPIFVISKQAECVPRLKKEGRVIYFESKKYKTLFLDAEKVISSSANEYTLNPFDKERVHVEDFIHSDFCYLQHGVACADLSSWLNRFNKNIKQIFTASEREKDSFINRSYGYTDRNVFLTGQARFDDLYDQHEKLVLILPTWRKSINQSYDSNTTTSIYYNGFKDTEYFQFYNGLINDPRLLNKMREKGYKGIFCLHPNHMKQWVDFQGNDVFTVNQGYVDYYTMFAKAALTVTDYSSAIFDFAYLRKYIIYAQFDREEFFAGQIYDEGYFSYENDGFGPISSDLESTVETIITALDNDCIVLDKYLNRMNSFFAFNDRKNCERIYHAICEYDNSELEFQKFSEEYVSKDQIEQKSVSKNP